MQTDIIFRGMDPSAAAEDFARRWFDRLQRVYSGIVRCTAVIEIPHHHQQRDPRFHVRLEIAVPGEVICVTADPGLADAHDDLMVTLGDAFKAARRQLQHYTSRWTGNRHADATH